MHFILTAFIFLFSISAQAVEIQQVVSPKLGIKAYLVESSSLPMVNIQVAFRNGSAFDPKGQGGLSNLTSSLFDEGAADKNSKAYTESLESIGSLFSVNASLLNTTFSMRMLSDHKQESLTLLRDAIRKPRFDDDAFLRMQDAVLSGLKSAKQNPGHVAGLLLKEHLYENHPYGRPTSGTEENVQNFKVSDVRSFYQNNFTRKNMTVSVVGDMTKDELEGYLDTLFIDLKEGDMRHKITLKPSSVTPAVIRQSMAVPQSSVYLAHLGINREDADYYAAYAMNYVLGGGGFNSRLMAEIREKRGLAYGVSSYFEVLPIQGGFITSVSTKNKDVQTAIDLIKKEMRRIKKHGVTAEEYAGAMSYLKGSFPLRLDSSSKIIGYLTVMQMEGLGVDYLENWTKRIATVTRED
ncbi:MAG: zinc protease, partial [bacterium]